MDPHSVTLITTLLLVFVSAVVGGLVMRKFKLPMLLGYILGGIVSGNLLPGFTDQSFLRIIADSGVTLLLFTLGVEFSFGRLKRILRSVVWVAVMQILIVSIILLFLLMSLGFSYISALMLAIAGSLSSTAVVVKILSERGELDTVPGEVLTGWLVVQDLAVVPIMILLPAVVGIQMAPNIDLHEIFALLSVGLGKAALAVFVIVFLVKRGVPKLLTLVSTLGNREILLLTTVGLVFVSALISSAFGLSAALGAFIAGLLIAESSENHAVFAEVRPLRDLFAVVFFVTLGMMLPWSFLAIHAGQIVGLALLVMAVKVAVIGLLTRVMAYHRKTSFIIAIGLSQMSEFGFIIAKEGVSAGVLNADQYVLLVAIAFLTICISSPLFSGAPGLYYVWERWIGKYIPPLFVARSRTERSEEGLAMRDHVVICGYGRVGKYIGRALEMAAIPYAVVDYNHATVSRLLSQGVTVVFGDPADKGVLDFAQVDHARALVIAIPDRHTQELVISHAQTLNRKIKIICRTHHEEDQRDLKSLGVATIVQPEFEAALSIIGRLLPDFGVAGEDVAGKISRLKIEHGLG